MPGRWPGQGPGRRSPSDAHRDGGSRARAGHRGGLARGALVQPVLDPGGRTVPVGKALANEMMSWSPWRMVRRAPLVVEVGLDARGDLGRSADRVGVGEALEDRPLDRHHRGVGQLVVEEDGGPVGQPGVGRGRREGRHRHLVHPPDVPEGHGVTDQERRGPAIGHHLGQADHRVVDQGQWHLRGRVLGRRLFVGDGDELAPELLEVGDRGHVVDRGPAPGLEVVEPLPDVAGQEVEPEGHQARPDGELGLGLGHLAPEPGKALHCRISGTVPTTGAVGQRRRRQERPQAPPGRREREAGVARGHRARRGPEGCSRCRGAAGCRRPEDGRDGGGQVDALPGPGSGRP